MRLVALALAGSGFAVSVAVAWLVLRDVAPLSLRTDPQRRGDGLRGAAAALAMAWMLIAASPGMAAAFAWLARERGAGRAGAVGLGGVRAFLTAGIAFVAAIAGWELLLLSFPVAVQVIAAAVAVLAAAAPAGVIARAVVIGTRLRGGRLLAPMPLLVFLAGGAGALLLGPPLIRWALSD